MTVQFPIIDGWDVATAVEAHLKLWSDTWLREIERQRSTIELPVLNKLPSVESFDKSVDDDYYSGIKFPACLIVCPGLSEPPTKSGKGEYQAKFTVMVTTYVKARTPNEVERNARWYAAAHRQAILAKPSLNGFAEGSDWIDERYDILGTIEGGNVAAGQSQFTITVNGASHYRKGPAVPGPTIPDPVEAQSVQNDTSPMEDQNG